MQGVDELQVWEHAAAKRLLPCPCAGEVGEDEVNQVRGVPSDGVAIDGVGIVRVPI